MSSDFEIERRCSHEKKPGIVQLSATHLVWTPDSAADGAEVRVSFTSIRQFQVSKEGSAKKAMIRLSCSDRSNKITFDFSRNFTDRDAIRDVLNKLQARPTASPLTQSGSGSTPSPQVAIQAKVIPAVSAEERARRQKLLRRKEVRRLHGMVVRSGAVTDESFWNAMKFRYKANGERKVIRGVVVMDSDDEELKKQSVQGVPSDAYEIGRVDSSDWVDGVPNAGQRHLVFMEAGAVGRAYESKVGEIGEKKFWEIYLRSSYAKRRAGMSKAESVKTGEADGIFAGFEAGAGDIERKEREERVKGLDRGLDLDRFDAHRGAHMEEGRLRKIGGMEGEGLRLMRRVNRHGSLIIGGAKGWEDEEGDKGRPLDDLDVGEEERFAELGMKFGRRNDGIEDGSIVIFGVGELVNGWGGLEVGMFRESVEGSGGVLMDVVGRMKL